MIRIDVSGSGRLPATLNLTQWGNLMTDVALWKPVVTEIVTAVGLDPGPEINAGYPGSCAVFIAGGQAVVKLFPPFFVSDFAVELAVYELLDGRTAAVPSLLASGTYHDRIDWPFLVLSFCSGEPIRSLHKRLGTAGRNRISQQTGAVLRAVHHTPIFPEEPFTPWPVFLQQRYERCLLELRNNTPLSADLLEQIARLLAELTPELRRERSLLLNADLTDDHVFVAQEAGSWDLQAIIDWADAEVGPPCYEWIAAWFGFCRRDPVMFRALVSSCTPDQVFDETFQRKLLACTFLHRFGSLIVRERWQIEPPPANLSLLALGKWLWPGIIE